MNAKDALKTQYRFFYLTTKSNLTGLTAEDSIKQPSPGGNCANWILGHVVHAHNRVMELAHTDPVWSGEDLSRLDAAPITSADEAVDWDGLVEGLLGSEERLLAAIDALTDEQLDDEGFVDPFGNDITRGEALNFLAVHQNYHAGQLGLSRRLAGHDGVIRAPDSEAAAA